ncbi:hypothetical protein KGA66_17310 [Actinocrinis puniceicyclus]|uniref:Uncharacterized protein n=1 Tax=Actinocrinis puniceicyclus TaxID=977794 RepID=A0A8J7WTB8_9ACTN|nr:hypothetical protein [Actinocrinis puniceicyclus]MBS2964819.1 hypothetical protein [Actinocrinis puniceicyclus]
MTLRLETMAEPDALLGSGDAAWQASGPFATPGRLAAAGREGDPRCARKSAVAFQGAAPVGVLGLYRPRNGRPPDPAYALGALGHGHRRIRLGLAAGPAKTLRGAKTSSMWAFLRARADGECR